MVNSYNGRDSRDLVLNQIIFSNPPISCSLCNRRWKPVNTEDLVGDEEDRHPSIIKNGGLDETALTEAGEVNVNNEMTTVTWTSDEKEDLKKADTKEEKVTKEEKEPEKEAEKETEKEVEKEAEKEGEKEEKEAPAGEDAPLKPEEN